MIPGSPFRWTEPGTWPWFVYLWLTLTVAGLTKPIWRSWWQWFKRNKAGNWLSAQGRIDSVGANQPKELLLFRPTKNSSTTHFAELKYSYLVGGDVHSGIYKREFPTEWEAWEFLRDLEGKPVEVLYDPDKPSSSMLTETPLDTLLKLRAPAPEDELAACAVAKSVPAWLKPFLWIFLWLSGVGLALSFMANVGALMGHRIFPEALFFILHIGIFVVWFPAIFVAKRRIGNLRRKDFWKAVLKGVPDWMRYCVYGALSYATVDGAISMLKVWPQATGPITPIEQWHFFSDTWIGFYAAAFAILFAAATEGGGGGRCLSGHPVSLGAKYCGRCGQPVVRSR